MLSKKLSNKIKDKNSTYKTIDQNKINKNIIHFIRYNKINLTKDSYFDDFDQFLISLRGILAVILHPSLNPSTKLI